MAFRMYVRFARTDPRIRLWDTVDGRIVIEFGRGGLLRTFHCEPAVLTSHRFTRSILVEKQVPLVVLSGLPPERPKGIIGGFRRRRTPKTLLHWPPGHCIALVYQFLFPHRVCERIFDQIVHDMREEYYESTRAGRDLHARWVWVRGLTAVWLGMLRAAWTGAVRHVVRVVKLV